MSGRKEEFNQDFYPAAALEGSETSEAIAWYGGCVRGVNSSSVRKVNRMGAVQGEGRVVSLCTAGEELMEMSV